MFCRKLRHPLENYNTDLVSKILKSLPLIVDIIFYIQRRRSGPKSGGGGGGAGLTKSSRVRQIIVKQTGCLPFEQVAPKRLPFAQDTTKQRYLSRKATMGIFELYERSHIKRY